MIRGFCSDLPASGIARDFVSLAGVHRLPEHVSTGLALMIGSREADHMHPGLVALPGSGAVFETPVAASIVAAFLPAGQPGGGVLGRRHPFIARENLSLTLRRQPASDALREISEALPCLGSLHGPNHGASHARKAVKDCQELGNVCRA